MLAIENLKMKIRKHFLYNSIKRIRMNLIKQAQNLYSENYKTS